MSSENELHVLAANGMTRIAKMGHILETQHPRQDFFRKIEEDDVVMKVNPFLPPPTKKGSSL